MAEAIADGIALFFLRAFVGLLVIGAIGAVVLYVSYIAYNTMLELRHRFGWSKRVQNARWFERYMGVR